MKYILIKFDNDHCDILENGGLQMIFPTRVDAIRMQAKYKDYTIVPMTDIISLVDKVNTSVKGIHDYCTYDNAKRVLLDIKSIFSEI